MTDPIYFFATNTNLSSVLQNGMRCGAPLNCDLDPAIDVSSVTIWDRNNEEKKTQYLKVNNYVRLVLKPQEYLITYNGSLEEVFIIEVNSEIMTRPDILKIRHVKDRTIEYLKLGMVHQSCFRQIHVYSCDAKEKLLSLMKDYEIKTIVNPALFHSPTQKKEYLSIEKPQSVKQAFVLCKGNLLDSSMQTLVNTVNCAGVMGKGIALTFKKNYPEMFKDYARKCKEGQVSLGRPYCYYDKKGKIILNFPTKSHWKNDSPLESIEKGLQYLVAHAKEWGIRSIAIPPLGCGLGGLCWNVVFPIIQYYISQLNIPTEIYPPTDSASFSPSISDHKLPALSEGDCSQKRKFSELASPEIKDRSPKKQKTLDK